MNIVISELPKENKGFMQAVRPLFDPEVSLYEYAFGDLKNEICHVFFKVLQRNSILHKFLKNGVIH